MYDNWQNLQRNGKKSKHQKSTGEEQAILVYNALEEWSLSDIVQAMCFDTTPTNIGRLNETYILNEQKLGNDLLYLPNQDLQFIKALKLYEIVNSKIS